ncbi:MAG: hypothetical protein HRT34_03540 [Alcanivorax sp.]|jgi:hypothetical protein|nr:hypothetical protein [Alcanivorax sp.]|tara:strand:+ start:2574 stop:2969 length:396 start_codon:yes stop_codon:yes gene_type:complete
MMIKLVFSLSLFFLCSGAVAAKEWFSNLQVEQVLVYTDHGYNIVTAKFSNDHMLETNCTPTDTHNIVSYWTKNGISTTLQSWISVLLSAQAQQLPVDILVDVSNCNNSASWTAFDNPLGLGAAFYGVKASR